MKYLGLPSAITLVLLTTTTATAYWGVGKHEVGEFAQAMRNLVCSPVSSETCRNIFATSDAARKAAIAKARNSGAVAQAAGTTSSPDVPAWFAAELAAMNDAGGPASTGSINLASLSGSGTASGAGMPAALDGAHALSLLSTSGAGDTATSPKRVVKDKLRVRARQPQTTAATAAGDVDGIRLTEAEQLRIKVIGHADLSDTYGVNADRTISFPAIGRLSIADMTLSQLEQTLTDKISNMTNTQTYVTAEIVRYRPVFMSGYVMSPGEVAWKPGMTVQQAIALAGGLFRMTTTAGPIQHTDQLTTEQLHAKRALTDLKFTLAKLAGLQAEKEGAETVVDSDRLIDLVGKEEAKSLLDAQRDFLRRRQSDVRAQVNALQLEKEAIGVETASLRTQLDLVNVQLDMAREILQGVNQLKKKNYVSNVRLLDAKRDVTTLQAQVSSIGVSMASLRRRELEINRQIVTAKQTRGNTVDEAIEQLQHQLAQQEIDYEGAQKAIAALSGGRNAVADVDDKSLSYEVTRKRNGLTVKQLVHEWTELKSGDVLVVHNEPASASSTIRQSMVD